MNRFLAQLSNKIKTTYSLLKEEYIYVLGIHEKGN